MNTNRQLDKAFAKAPLIPFDDSGRFIIFSDCHRGDNSISDEFAHNQNLLLHALEHYCREGYTFIENGDGDELWEHAASITSASPMGIFTARFSGSTRTTAT